MQLLFVKAFVPWCRGNVAESMMRKSQETLEKVRHPSWGVTPPASDKGGFRHKLTPRERKRGGRSLDFYGEKNKASNLVERDFGR